eukprot:TRINITY_DN6713_c0_g1_i1.p1 TRINITY_DN6713_c0_g1~~TRINITY_DN6713_c0_g1_i1.p1  ORF type:complete len:544 (-),score=61.17 TRINITY_DN6713_c0_g1_i1:897-2528(-)
MENLLESFNRFVFMCPVKDAEQAESELDYEQVGSGGKCSQEIVEHLEMVREISAEDGFTRWEMYTFQEVGVVVPVGQDCPSVFQGEYLFATFAGFIENYSYLVKKYCPESLQVADPQKLRLEEIRFRSPVTDAQLVCILYHQLGSNMVPKLRGSFSFVLYNARQSRVLVVNDNKGTFKLQYATVSEEIAVVSCGNCMPLQARERVNIEPGCMKYGCHSPPKKYTNTEEVRQSAAKEARDAAASALAGLAPVSNNKEVSSPPKTPPRQYSPTERLYAAKLQSAFSMHDISMKNQSKTSSTLQGKVQYNEYRPKERLTKFMSQGSYNMDTSPNGYPSLYPVSLPHMTSQELTSDSFDLSRASSSPNPALTPTATPTQDPEADYLTESLAALSALPKSLLDSLAGGDTTIPSFLEVVSNLLLSSDVGIVITDTSLPDNPVIYVNPYFTQVTGYLLSEIIGLNPRFLQASPGAPRKPSFTSMMVRRNIENGDMKDVRILNYNRQGVAIWNDMTLSPVYDGVHKHVSHWLGILKFSPVEQHTRPANYW